MKAICLSILLTGCSALLEAPRPANYGYVDLNTKLDRCVEKYIKLDLIPKEAAEICQEIFKRR